MMPKNRTNPSPCKDFDSMTRRKIRQDEADGQPKKATNASELILTFRHVEVLQFCQRGPVTRGSR